MSAVVPLGGTLEVPLDARDLRADREALSAPNPARVAAERRGDRFAWRVPALVTALEIAGDVARYPLGSDVTRDRLRALRAADAVVVDERPALDVEVLEYRGTLLPYQAAAVEALAAAPCGLAVGPCGSGKGEIIAALVGALGVPALVVVGQRELAHDLRARVLARLGVEAGIIGGGRRDVRRITVALVQSLDADTLRELRDAFGVVIVDEAHHAAAPAYGAVLGTLRTRRRYGLTATPDRADGLRPLVHAVLGPVVHEITRSDLVASGRSVEPRLLTVPTAFAFDYTDADDWTALLAALEVDEERDRLIVETTIANGSGELSAVLVGRVAHAERLAAQFQARGIKAAALTGKMPRRAREATLDAAREGDLDVIVGTQLLDEGVDLPRLSRVVLAWPAKAEGRIVQRIGRALRVHEGKAAPLAIDIVDEHVGVLRSQARTRRRVFERTFGSRREVAA